jgi:hypothetical protein
MHTVINDKKLLNHIFLSSCMYVAGEMPKENYAYVGSDEPAPGMGGGFSDSAIRRGFIRKVSQGFKEFSTNNRHLYLNQCLGSGSVLSHPDPDPSLFVLIRIWIRIFHHQAKK